MAASQDHLERNRTVQADLLGLVDDAHAAATDFMEDFVTRHRWGRCVIDRPLTKWHDAAEVDTIRLARPSWHSGQR